MNWTEVAIGVIALYGAILATAIALARRRECRTEIKVKVSSGFLTFADRLSDPMIIVEASNVGHRPVTLSAPFLVLPDGKSMVLLNVGSDVDYPHELVPGRNCRIWIEAESVAEELRRAGFSGKVMLVGAFRDQSGCEWKGRPYRVEID